MRLSIVSSAGRLLLAAWAIAVVVVVSGSLAPAFLLRKLPPVAVPDNDKAAHFLAYVILAMLPVVAADVVRMGLLLALAMIPLGVALEFFQQLVPTRSFELADMAANTLGVLTGVLIALWLRGFRRTAAEAE